MAENKLTEIISASLEQIKQVVDANTIIGNPITTPNGTTIIPFQRSRSGFASGGLDYLGKNMKKVADAAAKPGRSRPISAAAAVLECQCSRSVSH